MKSSDPTPQPAAHQWDLSPLLTSDTSPDAATERTTIRDAAVAFAEDWRDRTDYLSDPSVLAQALADYEAWHADYGYDGKAGAYFWLRSKQDQDDPAVQAGYQQAADFAAELEQILQFFELRLGRVDADTQTRLLSAVELRPYRHYLERLFARSRHLLSEAEERIMTLKYTTSHEKWVQLTSKAVATQERTVRLPDGTVAPQSYEQLVTLCSNKDKLLRDQAAAAVNDILAPVRPVAEAELNAILANKKVDDELRGFDRPDASRHLSDDMSTATVDALLEAVTARNDIAHRFYQLKARLLDLPQLAYHERNLEVGQVNQTYDWSAATELVQAVYHDLDPEFGALFHRFLESGQFDVYPRRGKRGGAFCVSFNRRLPVYVLLNYTDQLKDVTTLAHEFGHALNDELMRTQLELNYGTPLSMAEVASQYFEDFVYDRLLTTADDDTRLALNMTRLNDAVSSIFRQVACYRFEQSLHRSFRSQGYLAADDIGRLFQDAMAAYMGPSVEQSPGSENWWINWSHIRTFFYVYSYASGLLIAKAMQHATRQDRAFIAHLRTFLSAGRSAAPHEIFATMGIDINDRRFWQSGLSEVERLLTETEALAAKTGK